ncbi:kelch repeat-containing protein [Rhodocytophaga aerolata]|uniref:Kelch repeat-containing protein n=1 Tax=Rhodocytophaga aerolata TaxID=455078 RepID=A0ABT8QYU9_9BACT|nr:kelch repeat-containing protein [Rhodocytophaga aerolata]MDO1445023.1 kelch repeat-containing protein [Rhodocytophaga aerolata]
MRHFFIPSAPFLLSLLLLSFTLTKEPGPWKLVAMENEPEKRHENAFVRVGDSFYLVGGRNIKPVEAYNTKTRQWKKLATPPLEMHHFQAIEYKGEIVVAGAFTGGFPHETPIPKIQIYNPTTDKWREGAEIPENRRRGAAGVVVYQDKIYLVCGIIDGHYDGHVTWLDEYDPKTNKWRQLPDAPHARDHFQAAVVNNQLFVAGGRRSTHKTGHVLDLTVPEVDIFDFKTNTWKTLPAAQNIPTQRAGTAAVTLGKQVLIIGGESPQKLAHNQTEAFDFKTNTWQTLAPLQTGRHGTQAILYQNKVFVAAGSANQGGGPELNTMEVLE